MWILADLTLARNLALAFAASGNCRKVLVQFELAKPRRDISNFRFCLDVRPPDGRWFEFAAMGTLSKSDDGLIKDTKLKNLLPNSAQVEGETKWSYLLDSHHVQLTVLDKRGNVYPIRHFYGTSSGERSTRPQDRTRQNKTTASQLAIQVGPARVSQGRESSDRCSKQLKAAKSEHKIRTNLMLEYS